MRVFLNTLAVLAISTSFQGAFAETLAEIGARLGRETQEAYGASPFAELSRDYFARFHLDADATPAEGEMHLTGTWTLWLPAHPTPVTEAMAGYLEDFLVRRMRVEVTQQRAAEEPAPASHAIVLLESGGGDPEVPESFTLSIAPERVTLRGRDANGLRDAMVKLVDLMGFREAPILPLGEQAYTPRLQVRLGAVPIQGSYRELVFLGHNAVFAGGGSLYALSTSEAIPELAVRRVQGLAENNRKGSEEARRHGLKTYAFVDMRQKFPEDDPLFAAHPEIRGARTWSADGEFTLCTSHPLVQQWLRESAAGVFAGDPELNGMVLIIGGEGFYHCFMRPHGVTKGHTNCTRCEPRGAETVVAELCNLLAEAARSVRPDAEVIIWPYSAEHVWSADKTQETLIEKLKPGVALLTEIEKDEYVQKPGGVNKHLWDYSIDLIGPGERAQKQIAACQAAGINVYLKSEPELAFEASRLPHVPCMDRWVDRAEALASCGATGAFVFPAFRPNYGTSAAEVSKFMWWAPAPEKEDLLERFAARWVGAEAGPHLREAWRQVSESIPLVPVIPTYYKGPQYLGPAHPMILDPEAQLPEVFHGYYLFYAEISDAEGVVKRPTYEINPVGDVPVFADYYRRMTEHLTQATLALELAETLVPESHRLLFEAEASPTRWFHHTIRTTANFYEAAPLRDTLRACGELSGPNMEELLQAYDRLREILRDEQANTEAALPVIEADMRLDFYYGSDHTFPHAADMMREKLRILQVELDETLPGLTACRLPPEPDFEEDPRLLDRVVYHTQGWGELGDGVAAHAPGTEALPLQIGEKHYTFGLGTHAPSETVLLLDGQYLAFEAVAGVQEQQYDSGSVEMQVFVDGEKAFDSGVITQATGPRQVYVDLTGAQELQLVVTDAGDGITCDVANWAQALLLKDPGATPSVPEPGVDMAPFAAVRTWNPARTEGTTATRLEPIPAEELFLETTVVPDADGRYAVPRAADGRGCIGIEWLERRRLRQIELQFAEDSAMPENLAVEYWQMGYSGRLEGGSRWQGQWLPMDGEVTREGNRWSMLPDWSGKPEARNGTLKVRWIFPDTPEPVRLAAMHAYTRSRFDTAEVTLSVESADRDAQGAVTVYNGAVEGAGTLEQSWPLSEPLTLKVRYAVPRPWQMTDRTVLRFSLPGGSFGVAVDDVVHAGPVYVPHAGLFVTAQPQAHDLAAYRTAIADKQTRLEEVRALPEQTIGQALEHVYIPGSSFGPTMLSLACDNRKFILDRMGNITFENEPAAYNHVSGRVRDFHARLQVGFGGEAPEDLKRELEQAWLPIVRIERAWEGITLRQRTFIAPLGEPQPGAPLWLRERALGVAEFTLHNPGAEPAAATLHLDFAAQFPEAGVTTVQLEGARAQVYKGDTLLAVVETVHGSLELLASTDTSLRVTGDLPSGAEARCVVYLPVWEGSLPEELPAAGATETLARDTEAYWKTVLAEGMQVETPDPLITALVPASMMHCMIAARNDAGRTIAPWIAAYHYGPWESETHSVLRGMHAMGQMDFARRGLEYLIERYNEEGFLTTGYTVLGTGWHLWTLGEYYALTKDADWLRQVAPEAARVCRWVMAERDKTRRLDAHGEKVPEYGLMPPGVLADWDAFNYYFYMNGYYYAGLLAAGAALADIGWPGAEEILANAAEYREEILRAYGWVQARAPVVPLHDGAWAPYYPTHVYAPTPIEYLYAGEDFGRSWCYDIELGAHHLIPLGVIDPKGPQADWVINHLEDVQFLRSGWFHFEDEAANKADWFNLGGFSKVQPYYTRTAELHAMRHDVKPFLRTYFNSLMSLLNREDLSLWEHFVSGAFNKTHETGYFLYETRLMLVQERGEDLWLAPLIPSQWMRDGGHITVRQAPTRFGPVAYAITSQIAQDAVTATIEPPTRALPAAIVIRLPHPEGAPLQSAAVTGAAEFVIDAAGECLRIVPSGGTITVNASYLGNDGQEDAAPAAPGRR